jgi:hypothetical protein
MLAECLAELRTRVRATLALPSERLALATSSETWLTGKPITGIWRW